MSALYENDHFKVKLLAPSPGGGGKAESALTSVYAGSTELWGNIWPHTERTNTNRARDGIERNPCFFSQPHLLDAAHEFKCYFFRANGYRTPLRLCLNSPNFPPFFNSYRRLCGPLLGNAVSLVGVWRTHPPAILSLFPAQSPGRNRYMVSGGKVR